MVVSEVAVADVCIEDSSLLDESVKQQLMQGRARFFRVEDKRQFVLLEGGRDVLKAA